MRQSVERRISYFRLLVSYLSLQHEGNRHITMAALKAREELLSWVFDLVQVPFPLAEVTECDDKFMDSLVGSASSGRYLSRTSSGAVVGLQPRVPPSPSAPQSSRRFVLHSQARRVWPLLPWTDLPPGFESSWQARLAAHAFAGAGSSPEELDARVDLRAQVRRSLGFVEGPRRHLRRYDLDVRYHLCEGERLHSVGEEDRPVEGELVASVVHRVAQAGVAHGSGRHSLQEVCPADAGLRQEQHAHPPRADRARVDDGVRLQPPAPAEARPALRLGLHQGALLPCVQGRRRNEGRAAAHRFRLPDKRS